MGPCSSKTNDNYDSKSAKSVKSDIKQKMQKSLDIPIHTEFLNTVEQAVIKTQSKPQKINKNQFLPHIYNSFTEEDVIFYKKVIAIKKSSFNPRKSCSTLNELQSFLYDVGLSDNSGRLIDRDETEKKKLLLCWKLFKWINENITFDAPKYEDEENNNSILIYQRGGAMAIAELYKKTVESFKIECIVISGYLKGKTYKAGCEVTYSNHEWNAVKIFNDWRLIDCSVVCSNNPYSGVKETKYAEFFFCTPPHHLIYTHYPFQNDSLFLHQGGLLLEKTDFEKLCCLKKAYFLYLFQLSDYKNTIADFNEAYDSVISLNDPTFNNEFSISFFIPEGIEIFAKIKSEKSQVNDNILHLKKRIPSQEEIMKKLVNMTDYYFYYEDILWHTNNYEKVSNIFKDLRIFELMIRIPEQTSYEIDIFACENRAMLGNDSEMKEEMYDYCFSYSIPQIANPKFKKINVSDIEYPYTTRMFINSCCEIIEPTCYHLKYYFERKKNINFLLKIPNAKNAAIFYDKEGKFSLMSKMDECTFCVSHCIDEAFQTATIAASWSEEKDEYYNLVTYSI